MQKEETVDKGLEEERQRAMLLGRVARIRVDNGDLDGALALHEERLSIFGGLGDRRSRAVTLGDIARILKSKGDVDRAFASYGQALGIFQELGDEEGTANTLWSIGRIEMQREQYQQAREHMAESYAILLKLERLDGICWVGLDLGQLLYAAGQREEGLLVLRRSRDGFRRLGQEALAQQVEGLITTVRRGG